MFQDVSKLLSGEKVSMEFVSFLTAEKAAEMGFDDIFCDVSFEFPIEIKGRIENHGGYMFLSETASIKLSSYCARCAKAMNETVEFDFKKDISQGEISDEEFSDDYIYVVDKKVDVVTSFCEEIIMEFPKRFLCSDDCLGLCPKCGADLNVEKCKCEKEIDERLLPLKKLLEK